MQSRINFHGGLNEFFWRVSGILHDGVGVIHGNHRQMNVGVKGRSEILVRRPNPTQYGGGDTSFAEF